MKTKMKHPPSLRVGICPLGYSKTISLGQEASVGYKSTTGQFIFASKAFRGGEGFEE